ncbi:hypothetical protein AUEXF2481DRAFT_36454 [Aureobasidium subglaciale EXF-2481]|uniref:Uncharacterized protein n=1 Tax=Aureobasidium subglaciale (strain EXF-2481) TaxID=1043005 RepID=A0A074YSP5_AURSE|nr:uncharacterized protein AUEXF2481DRAFT_36454 [Aureobasidium subglaciale EXF-2481]KAI5207656.1 hypothetical protein E4T38_03220 [Aureobasidium subglaciale]KAI5226548.1 hypothetical protein E4T40_02994 [Aureobasidium subglaciale]KAI5229924.1 hypothetical protein E4T41_03217 [Aureobasidium subglaciale]KAI5264387.1 hypothetical protein E4T46_02995 [Aureobasidium subglaciale]KEQ99154.1 hypothetical protein AUEXF2481DRAFT_36454 [Aureobasidium subglaciale EXF-2481]
MKTAIATAAAAAAMLSTMANAQAFTLKALTPAGTNNIPLVAWNGMFIGAYPGNRTTATCPSYDPNCPGKDTTIFSGPVLGKEPTQLWLGILQQGGQRVYMHEPTGALEERAGYGQLISYTAAGNDESANVPMVDKFEDLFNIIEYPDVSKGTYGAKEGDLVLAHGPNNDTSFNFCTETIFAEGTNYGGYTSILSTIGKYCSPINVGVEYTTVDAPQFYNCEGCEYRSKNGPACEPPFCGSIKKRYQWL